MSIPGIDCAWRAELTECAGRLRAAAEYVVLACEARGEVAPGELTTWPSTPRRTGGWAGASDGDQAEDERLHDVVAAGRNVVVRLAWSAVGDPTVQLAMTYFEDAARRYERASTVAHAALREPGLSVTDAAYGVHASVTELLHAIQAVEDLERGMVAVRLVPAVLTVAADNLRNDLADLVEPPDDGAVADPMHLRLVRHLDGTLGVVGDHADRLPESMLTASAIAADALGDWDRATGSFRDAGDRGATTEHSRSVEVVSASPTVEVLATAEHEMAHRVEIAVDAALGAAHRRGHTQPPASLQALARESRLLRGARIAPPAFAARDSVYRDHAMRLDQAALELAAHHLDTIDGALLSAGRAALAAGRAAEEYLTLSDAAAASVRSRRMVVSSGDAGGDSLEAIANVWRRLDEALRHEPLSDVARAEWCAFTADLEWAHAARDVLSSTTREAQLRQVAIERRLADSLCGLVRGDVGAHLVVLPGGGHVLTVLEATSRRFDAELGLARLPARAPDRGVGEWLASRGAEGRAPTQIPSRIRPVGPCRDAAVGRSAARDAGPAAQL